MQIKTLLLGTFFTSGAAMFSLHQQAPVPAKVASIAFVPAHRVVKKTPPPVVTHKHHAVKPVTHAAHSVPVKTKHKPYFFHTKTANS